jgi:hypothetical protein
MATAVAKNTIQADISSETVVLTYLYTGEGPIYLVPRVDVVGIVGGAQYVLSVRISNDIMTPVSGVEVPTGQTTAVLMGRHPIAIEPNEQVEILVQGQSLDTAVTVTTTLFDSTPVSPEDLNEILEQIQNISIVAIRERVVLGPCQRGTSEPPDVCDPAVVSPSVSPGQRTVKSVPQVIPRTPMFGE